jgi:signal transduction histidine kinase/ActR/RegA family two-component response regulator
VTDTARELTHAEYGAFFYNARDTELGDAYMLSALSGAPKEAWRSFRTRARRTSSPRPFAARDRSASTTSPADPRFGRHPPYEASARPPAAAQLSRGAGQGVAQHRHRRAVLRPLQVGAFTERHERLAEGIAGWAALALENARLLIEARDANRMKDDFLAVLSHELRTPLNAIVGYSRLLRSGMLSGEKRSRGLETLERNANWLTQIVEDVLDVSRIISGKIRLDVQPVHLPLVIDNAVATVQPAADAKGVRIQTILDPNAGPVSGDPDRLQQIVWNLLTNAVKFTPRGGRVQARLEQVNSHIEVVISDTGSGIAPDFLPYVFERFRQADAGITRKTGGLGLGLSIVHHIVEMHGGTVEAASDGLDRGATFRVRLPLMIVHERGSDSRREHPRSPITQPLGVLGDLTGVRVVAVDDEEDALTLLRVVLEAAGAEVATFASPIAALDHLAVDQPDALIVDVGMPEMDGFEFIGRIRASSDPRVRELPAAALTAFARSQDRAKALRSGFEMHMSKPVDPSELVASVATLVRRARASS